MAFNVADLCDEFGQKTKALKPFFSDFGGRSRSVGVAPTAKCVEDSWRVKELSRPPKLGRIRVIDAGGSDRCALVGNLIAGGFCI